MRNLHKQLSIEYGRESVKKLHRWEKYERKMVDFSNHRRFTLRCLAEDLVPVSICLKQSIRTPKGLQIIRRAERSLLNERVRSISNTLNMLKALRDTCREELKRVISNGWMVKCEEFIEVGRERQHLETLKRHKAKLVKLLQQKQIKEERCKVKHGGHTVYPSNATIHNNNTDFIHAALQNNNYSNCAQEEERNEEDERDTTTKELRENIWVKNLSSTSLTEDQIKALACGPNFAIVPRRPPLGEYITAIENVCNQLPQGKAEELRGEIKSVMKRVHPTRSNITQGERKAIEELRKDNTKIVVTMDKGVAMVVMDRDDYHRKADALLEESTYRPIPNDPTNKYKTRLIALLKSIKAEGGINETTYKKLYPTGQVPPSSMDYQKSTRQAHH